ncbi:hypothetical protein D3C85_619970 [compost metagenome]
MLIDGADVAAVDVQVGQAQLGEVADLVEAAAEVLQADVVAGVVQALAQLAQLFRRW